MAELDDPVAPLVMPDGEPDDVGRLHRAREAAQAVATVAGQLEDFAQRLTLPVGPADMAQFDTLLSREEQVRMRRGEAFDTLGLAVPSIEG